MVTLHGVYSWVAPEIRREIVQFLKAKVKPGGHVYISYNSQPGWNGCVPVQRLIHEFGKRLPGASTSQVMGAIGFAQQLAEVGAAQLSKDDKFLEQIVKTAQQADVAYLAHEYMNSCWTPLFHYEVVQELAEAKLGFVGSANLFDNFPRPVPEGRAQGTGQPDRGSGSCAKPSGTTAKSSCCAGMSSSAARAGSAVPRSTSG